MYWISMAMFYFRPIIVFTSNT